MGRHHAERDEYIKKRPCQGNIRQNVDSLATETAMKHSSAKARKHKTAQSPQRKPEAAGRGPTGVPRWAIIVICLLVAAGGTWSVFEFVVWAKLPAELVGKWEVTEGPQRGAIFNFARNGTLEAHLQSPDPNKM